MTSAPNPTTTITKEQFQFQFFTSHNGDYGSQDRLQAPYTSVLCVFAAVVYVVFMRFYAVVVVVVVVANLRKPLTRN